MSEFSYALITAARDEEKYIKSTLESVGRQTHKPAAWVIVSDGSMDDTDDIIKAFACDNPFVRFLRLEPDRSRNFQSQVYAINAGIALLDLKAYDLVGNLDADISLAPTYYDVVLRRFENDPLLGLAGGWIYEATGINGAFVPRRFNSVASVPHGVQLFRRRCFEEIGGYVPLPYGGPDWCAEVTARMNGWKVQTYTDLPVMHHKPSSSVEGAFRAGFRHGRMDNSLGSHPLFEFFKCCSRSAQRPFFIYAIIRLIGFLSSYLVMEKRPVSIQFVKCIRAEQINKLRSLLPDFGRR